MMNNTYDDRYWQETFDITEADLDRLAARIRLRQRAEETDAIARHVVLNRLVYGEDHSPRAPRPEGDPETVRWWDQVVDDVQVGDHLYFLVSGPNGLQAHIGEVTAVQGTKLHAFISALQREVPYSAKGQSPWKGIAASYRRYREQTRQRSLEKRLVDEHEDSIENVLLDHGGRVAELLLDALQADDRFLRLSGRWFLHDIAQRPTAEQVHRAAWAIVREPEPPTTNDLLATVGEEGDAALFGLYLALQECDDIFQLVSPGPQPRWRIVKPPPGSFRPSRAAYDPESYELIALPGTEASSDAVQRLWETDLLKAVL